MKKIEDILRYQDSIEIKKNTVQLKKITTGLNKIILGYDKELLTDKDLKIIQNAENIVEKLIRKRSGYLKKKEREDTVRENKTKRNVKKLKEILNKFDIETKVKYIISSESHVIINFEYRYESFIESMASYMIDNNKTVEEIIEKLNSGINNTEHKSYPIFLQNVKESLKNINSK